MPKPNPYRHPSLKQLAFGFLMLLAKDVARAETHYPTEPSFTHCQHLTNDISPTLTPNGLWSLAHFKDETTISNGVNLLTDYPAIKDLCDQHGENYLFHLANHGSDDDFSNALAISKSKDTHKKNLVDKTLMDVLIENNDLGKISALALTLREESLFRSSLQYAIRFLRGSREKDAGSHRRAVSMLAVDHPIDPMSLAAKDHALKMIEKNNATNELSNTDASNAEPYSHLTVFITSAALTLLIISPILFCVWRRNNPNVLFNQPNANANTLTPRMRTEPERP